MGSGINYAVYNLSCMYGSCGEINTLPGLSWPSIVFFLWSYGSKFNVRLGYQVHFGPIIVGILMYFREWVMDDISDSHEHIKLDSCNYILYLLINI